MMVSKDWMNLAVSALLSGLATFWAIHIACTDPNGCWGAGLSGASTAAIAALIQHLRGVPGTTAIPKA